MIYIVGVAVRTGEADQRCVAPVLRRHGHAAEPHLLKGRERRRCALSRLINLFYRGVVESQKLLAVAYVAAACAGAGVRWLRV